MARTKTLKYNGYTFKTGDTFKSVEDLYNHFDEYSQGVFSLEQFIENGYFALIDKGWLWAITPYVSLEDSSVIISVERLGYEGY